MPAPQQDPAAPALQAVPIEQFLKCLNDCGLLAPDEIKAALAVVADDLKKEARSLAQELIKQGKLTRYQGTMLCQGKSKGLVLGNYTVLEKIGQGGMGLVFKAQHRRMKRTVALKVLSPKITSNATAVLRFQREVEAAAKLSHPNIVAAHDADEDKGVHFLVMEFVEGSDLSSLVKKSGPLPIGQAADCIVQAAQGLAHAHESGIVHRDIKPHNLLFAKKTVKILDMGLARVDAGGNAAPAGELTESGSIMGTCDYMAPEQALNTKRADHRADIYSLGCTLYYLLTGKVMYGGETAMEKLMAHQTEPVPPLRQLRPEVPADLEAIYQRMVAKKVEDRYQSMTEVIAAIDKIQAKLGAITTRPTGNTKFPGGHNPGNEETQAENLSGSLTQAGLPATTGLGSKKSKRWLIPAVAVACALLAVAVGVFFTGPTRKEQRPPGDKGEPVANQEIDLLKLIDPVKHASKGLWRFEGPTLVSPKGGLVRIPLVPPAEYEVEILAERRDGAKDLLLGLVAGDRAFVVILDGFAGDTSGLALLDGKTPDKNETAYRGKVFTNGQPTSIIARVQQQSIVVRAGAKTIIDWKGDFGRLSIWQDWVVPGPQQLALCAYANSFHIHKLVLRPLGKGVADSKNPAFEQWVKDTQGLTAEKQVQAVSAKLRELNPAFVGRFKPQIENGAVIGLVIGENQPTVSDFSPLRGLPSLRRLDLFGTAVTDLSFLEGMNLEILLIYHSKLASVAPLRGLTSLRWVGFGQLHELQDLTPLQGLKIETLQAWETGVSDLSPLANMPLVELEVYGSPVVSIAPLKGLPLKKLRIDSTKVKDFSLLAGLPLVEVWGDFKPEHFALLRSIKTLQVINGKPATQFVK